MTDRLPIDDLHGVAIHLPELGNHRKAAHVFERESMLAVNAALDCGRPLLIRGRPGVGKSQLARAVARQLRRVFLSKFIDARTEAYDLMWSYDAVTRLAEAQAWGHRGLEPERPELANDGADAGSSERLARRNYVEPGPLWWAFSWSGALAQLQGPPSKGEPPAYEHEGEHAVDPSNGAVLLIDEIDKADGSVPNGLLESLGHGEFAVPGIDEKVRITGPAPLVILTSNDDRVLPDAFLRRCLVLWLRVPMPDRDFEHRGLDDPLVGWLVRRGRAHFEDRISSDVYLEAALQVVRDRERVAANHRCAPGLAEYIDLLAALEAEPRREVAELSRFFLRKHADPGPPR